MTVQPELIDPYEAFWAQARDISDGQLTPEEEAEAVSISHRGRTTKEAEIAAALAAAFLLYRRYMVRRLTADLPPDPTALRLLTRALWQQFVPVWAYTVGPALVSGYILGAKEAANHQVPAEYLREVAIKYASDLGAHLHDTSVEGLVQGYTAQINRKIPPARAIQNAMRAFGVTPRATNALVTVWLSEDPKRLTSAPTVSIKDRKARRLIEADVKNRAELMGTTEAWTAQTQAKQIVWMYGVQTGLLPEDAARTWVTARDEKVCPVCGPMHKKTAPVGEKFKTANGEVWAPPVHPRCRCDVTLTVKSEFERAFASVTKAYGKDPYSRDVKGRFAEREGRHAKAFKDLRPMDPTLSRLLAEAREMYGSATPEQTQVNVRAKLGSKQLGRTPLGGKEQLGAKQLDREPIQRGELKRMPLSRAQLQKKAMGVFNRGSLGKPPESKSAQYFKLDEPMFAIIPRWQIDDQLYQSHKTGHILIGNDVEFQTNYAEVQRDMTEHWNEIVEDTMNHIEDSENGHYYVVVPYNGKPVRVKIEKEEIEDAFWAELSDDSSLLARQVEGTFEDPSGSTRTLSVSYSEISQTYGLSDVIEEEQPRLVIVNHGLPGVTEINQTKYGSYGLNPGNWKIARMGPGGGSERRFMRIWLEPPE